MEELNAIMAAWRDGLLANAETLAKLLLSDASDKDTLRAVSEITVQMLAED